MRFMMLVKSDPRMEAGVLPTEQELSEMGEYNDQLIKAGVMLAGEGLHASSRGTRVRISGKKTTIVDGPFTEAKELVAGFWIIQTKSKEEAVEWAKRVCFKEGALEVRALYEPEDFAVSAEEQPGGWRDQEAAAVQAGPPARKPGTTRYMCLLKADRNTEASMAPNEKLLTEMGALMDEVVKSGTLLAGDGLKASQHGFKVLYAGDKRTVVDGPFAETKELVAGYSIVQTATRAEAVEFARRMLQIHIDGTGIDSGEVEIRQVFEIEEFPLNAEEKPDGWRAKELAFRDGPRH